MADAVQTSGASAGHEGPHGHHDPNLAHHFDTMEQQFECGKLGMWLFLATEVLLFGGLFCWYAIWRSNHPEVFVYGAQKLDWKLGGINTIVLLVSSFTMAWAVGCAQRGNRQGLLLGLGITFLGGIGFMGIKSVEYTEKFSHGYYWGGSYNPTHHEEGHAADHADGEHAETADAAHAEAGAADSHGDGHAADSAHGEESVADSAGELAPQEVRPPAALAGLSAERLTELGYEPSKVLLAAEAPGGLAASAPPTSETKLSAEEVRNVHLFFSIYFCMTGLHGIHVLIGMAVIGWLFVRALRGDFGPGYFEPVDLGGLYWHLVDLIWIYLFPLFYLI